MQMNRAHDWQGKMLGRYRLVRLLGRGGMGEVWQAEDTDLHRQVAVKLLPSVMANETNYLRAFAREARTVASLEHPHILPVHDFGEERSGNDIITYLIMPLITGGSLADRLKSVQGSLHPDESLHYLRQAAQAIDYAHTRQVLHRDIKPGNMLLQQQWLLLADFGIARLLSSTTQGQTHAGSGTPDYMAPEQAQGRAEAASDRYSLAVVAYQMFSGRKPFAGDSPYEVLLKHIQAVPPSPRQFNPQLSQAVEVVLLRGLAKRPEARFHSCVAFVDTLEMSLRTGTLAPLAQDPEATLLAPWNKHAQIGQGSQSVIPPMTPPIGGANQTYPMPPAGGVNQTYPMPPAGGVNQTYPMSSTPGGVNQTYPMSSTPGGVNQTYPMPPTQRSDQRYAPVPPSQMSAGMYPGATEFPPNPGVQAPTSPETPMPGPRESHKINRRGLLIGGAVATGLIVAGGTGLALALHARTTSGSAPRPAPGPLKLISGVPLLRLTGHTKAVWNVVWHPGGRYLATAGDDTHVLLWDIEASLKKGAKSVQEVSQPLYNWKFSDTISSSCLSWSKDGSTLAALAIGATNSINIIPANRQSTPLVYSDTSQAAVLNLTSYFNLAWSPVENVLAVSVFDTMDAELWQYGHTSGPVKTLKGPPAPQNEGGLVEVENVAWSSDGAFLAGLRDDGAAVVWNARTGQILQSLNLPERGKDAPNIIRRKALAWSPHTNPWLASSDIDLATVWNAPAGKLLTTLSTDDPVARTPLKISADSTLGFQLNGLAWSPNGRYLAGSYEHSHQVYIWDMQNKTPKKTVDGFQAQDLLFGANVGHVSAKLQKEDLEKEVTIIDIAWSPDGRYLATASNDTTIVIWQVDGG